MNKYKLKKGFGDFLIAFGTFNTVVFSIAAVSDFFHSSTQINNYANLSISISVVLGAGVLPLISGYFIRKNAKNEIQKLEKSEMQNSILRLAKASSGIIKIADLIIELNITYEQAKELLASSVTDGLAQAEVDENGNLYYVFKDFLQVSK
jgi:predicted transcriptional regulator